MKTKIYLSALTMMAISSLSINSYGQEQKPQKLVVATELQRQKQQRNFYRKTLQVDSVKAIQVSQIQDVYKASLKLVEADTSITEAGRRAKIRILVESKNQKLRTLLSPAQQQKIIPTTEWEAAKPTKKP